MHRKVPFFCGGEGGTMKAPFPLIERAAAAIQESRGAVALTGAGISVESGIPDFRSAGGLWSRFDPLEYATIEAFLQNPSKVWEMIAELHELIDRAVPNAAHRALAELEAQGHLTAIVTQNIDDLHQRAGSRNVIEFHGNGRQLRCLPCGEVSPAGEMEVLPPTCRSCGAILKPDVVFFGEMIPRAALEAAEHAVSACDLLLVVGTSAEVAPAGEIPFLARRAGAVIIEVNLGPTKISPIAEISIEAPAGEALPASVERVLPREEGTLRSS